MKRINSPLLLVLLCILLLQVLLPPGAEAAWNPSGETTSAIYQVMPLQGRVHVTIWYSLKNLDEETRYPPSYYYAWYVSVPVEATNIKAYDSQLPLYFTTEKSNNWISLKLQFNRHLYYGLDYTFGVEYDLKNITESVAVFWIYGRGRGSSTINIIVPKGYYNEIKLSQEGYETNESSDNINYVYKVDKEGWGFSSRICAARKTEYKEISGTASSGKTNSLVTVKYWVGEANKAEYILDLYKKSLPAFEKITAIPLPVTYYIYVREATYEETNGFAGDNRSKEWINIAFPYMEVDSVLLHELAHYWANSPPFRETWMHEGYAELYTYLLLKELGKSAEADEVQKLRTEKYQEGKTRFILPLSQWSITKSDDPQLSFGYGKSFVFVFNLYQKLGLPALQQLNQQVSVQGDSVDWFDYIEILETITGKELGHDFVGWVVPDSFGFSFEQWQQAEKAYREMKTVISLPEDKLGIDYIRTELALAKPMIMASNFADARVKIKSTQILFEQWQSAVKVFRATEATCAQPTDTLGYQTVKDGVDKARDFLNNGQFSQAVSQSEATLSLYQQWQGALKDFRNTETTIGQPSDTLGFQIIQDSLDKAETLIVSGLFQQVSTQIKTTLTFFGQWQSALKVFRATEATCAQPTDTLGYQTVKDGVDKARDFLNNGQFSQAVSQSEATLSLYQQWQGALKDFRNTETTISQPSDTLGFQIIQDSLGNAKNSLNNGRFSEAVDQTRASLALFEQWKTALNDFRSVEKSILAVVDKLGFEFVERELENVRVLLSRGDFGKFQPGLEDTRRIYGQWNNAIKAFRAAEVTCMQPTDALGYQIVKDSLDKAGGFLSNSQFSQAVSQSEATLSLYQQWQGALKDFRNTETTIGQPSDTLGFQIVKDSLDKAKGLLNSGQLSQVTIQTQAALTLFDQWQTALKALRNAEESVAKAKSEGRTWQLEKVELILTEAKNTITQGDLEQSMVQSQQANQAAQGVKSPLGAILPYLVLAIVGLGIIIGAILILTKRKKNMPQVI